MKIVHETPTALVLKQKNYLGIFVGIIFFIVGTYLLISQGLKDSKLLLIAIIFIFVSLLVVVLTKFITLTIDKSSGKITLTSKGLVGQKSQDIALDQIQEIAIEESITQVTGNSGSRNQPSYNLVFYLKDGQGIPIHIDSPTSFSVGGFPIGDYLGRNKIIELGNKIASFIGVPFKDSRPPTVTDVISGVVNTIKNNQSNLEANPPSITNKTSTT